LRLTDLFIDQQIVDHPNVLSIIDNIHITPLIIDDKRAIFDHITRSEDSFRQAKDVLYLTQNKGSFIKKCPGTRTYTCCGYTILNIGTYCSMDCVYCILQAYFHPPLLQYFINQEDLMIELDALFSKQKTARIGTGEFTDSMIWDYWTDSTRTLVEKFASQKYAMLELKTKTSNIDKLESLNHKKKTVVAWSVNTETIINTEEKDTASFRSRLIAAKKCESWGYPIAFHFDPIILYEGCEKDYENVVEAIFSHVSSKNIIWISLGAFRFIPSLKHIIQRRFPHSKIIYGEFIPGLDGKMRYFKPLRIRTYQLIAKKIREIAPDVLVYFCMEDDEVWEKALGFIPSKRGGLPNMLNRKAIHMCGLNGIS